MTFMRFLWTLVRLVVGMVGFVLWLVFWCGPVNMFRK